MRANLQQYRAAVSTALAELRADEVIERIWARDHTVWARDPAEITNRLDWLTVADEMLPRLPELFAFVDEVRNAGITHVVLLGMGGSSLAPELFAQVFGAAGNYPSLSIIDSTDPGMILDHARRLDAAATLFLVATKSGGTVETLSAFKYFYNWTADALGADAAGAHFTAITDPGSSLLALAQKYRFRRVFQNNPNIGGRYSALSCFGLVPAALLGVNLGKLLGAAIAAAAAARPAKKDIPEAAQLGVILGELAKAGRDKLTLLLPGEIASLGGWIEQLVAESTGKDGMGILPVVGEPPAAHYSPDRLFAAIEFEGAPLDTAALEAAGHPVVHLAIRDVYDLGAQFFVWEFATAIAGYRLGIQPFDQPNVEAAKILARKMVDAYHQNGALPAGESAPLAAETLTHFLGGVTPGDYLCLQVYAHPAPELEAALHGLRASLRERTGAAVTVGYGPRFLHSTGQLHKGDAGNGLFIQIVGVSAQDAPIPDEAGKPGSAMSFDILKQAQALGDFAALRAADPPRRALRFVVGENPAEALRRLGEGIRN
jgi:glucose-6-phosphate isomerase